MSQPPKKRIAIPSAKEVRDLERQRSSVPVTFQPTGVGCATGQQRRPPGGAAQLCHPDRSESHAPQPLPGPVHSALPSHGQQLPRPVLVAQHQQPYIQPQPLGQHSQRQHSQPPGGGGESRGPPPVHVPFVNGFGSQPYQFQQHQQSSSQPPHSQQHQQQQPAHMLPGLQQAFLPNAIIVNRRQEGNPVLKHIRNVRWHFGDIVPDYLLGRDTAALFLSLRFHMLKPEYIYNRIKELQRSFRLRIVLCHVDTEDAVEPLAQVTRAAIGNDCTLICGWSNQECARYLETFKSYENKPAEVIQKDVGHDYVSRITNALTLIRGVNKTDVKTLGDCFGSAAGMFRASSAALQACPGIGPTKARRLFEAFHQPFRQDVTPGRPQQHEHQGSAAEQHAVHMLQDQLQQQQQQALTVAVEDEFDIDAEEEEDDFL